MNDQTTWNTYRPIFLLVCGTLLFIAAAFLARSLLAQSGATVSAGTLQLDEGESGVVPVTLALPDEMRVAAATIALSYDPTVVTYDTYTTAVPDQFPGTLALCNPVDTDGVAPDRVECNLVSATGINAPQLTVAELSFTGADSPSETVLDVTADPFADAQGVALDITAVDGRIVVGDPLSVTLTDSAESTPLALLVGVLVLLVAVIVVGLFLRNRTQQTSA